MFDDELFYVFVSHPMLSMGHHVMGARALVRWLAKHAGTGTVTRLVSLQPVCQKCQVTLDGYWASIDEICRGCRWESHQVHDENPMPVALRKVG